ncbi:MAG: hypothetical protein ACYSR0_00290 [Planctomycetota bacterium]|jgi:hypothetical protein
MADQKLTALSATCTLAADSYIYAVLDPSTSPLQRHIEFSLFESQLANHVTEGANEGTGFPVFREKSATSLTFRTLVAGTDVTLTSAASIVTIANAASEHHFSVTIGASNTWNNELIPVWQAPRGSSATIVEVLGTTSGTTAPTLNFNFQVRDFNAMQSAGIDVFAASQAATSATEQFSSFARAQIDPRGHLMFTTGSGAEAGSVNYLNLTVYYTT